jgi:N-acetylmuramoyl-L-alanine amidase
MRKKTYTLLILFVLICIPLTRGLFMPVCFAREPNHVIVLDPGHGGIDGGTQAGTILEKHIVFDIAKLVEHQLKKDHIKVCMTRQSDTDVSSLYQSNISSRHRRDLANRVRFFHETDPNFVISIHVNHSESSTASGGNVFYQRSNPFGVMFAPILQHFLNEQYHNRNRIGSGPYYILRASNVPVFLLEIGYISNPSDRSKLIDPKWQMQFARSLAKTIELGLAL